MRRIFFFGMVNIAILVMLSIAMRVAGVGPYLTAQGLDYQSLLIFSAVLGMAGSFISLAISKWMAKRSTGARVIENPTNATEQWLVQAVSRHAQAAGIGMPEVAIYDHPTPNAFATGARRDSALVAVSTGLMHSMTQDEVDGVLAHEVSHVANGDMITMALMQGVLNTFVLFFARVIGYVVDTAVLRGESNRGPGLGYFAVTIAAQIVLGLLASIVLGWFSRMREFRADAGGARLAGRENMIAALERLKRGSDGEPLPEGLAAFGISPGRPGRFAMLFSTHPPLDTRIERLRQATGADA